MSGIEDQLVTWLAEHTQVSKSLIPIGIGDDMAQIQWDQTSSVCITTDMLLENVHFDMAHTNLEQVGYKAMAASLSDCAAMATVPIAAVVSVGLPPTYGHEAVQQLHVGLQRAGAAFDCALVGGDTTRWSDQPGRLVVNIAMLSRAPAGYQPIPRDGACEGDVIAVTGALGGSHAGHHLSFTPRVREALTLAERIDIHAMIDLSDGLSSDLCRLCHASGVGASIRAADIPLSSAARASSHPQEAALHDGEDFELLFTLAPHALADLLTDWDQIVPITAIGTIQARPEISLCFPDGSSVPLVPHGYDHFQRKGETP